MLFSIIIPAFRINTNQFLTCVGSIQNQSCSDFECLIICSDDSVTTDLLPSDPRFHLFLLSQPSAPGVARNLGVLKSKGKYIVFIDSDDYIDPDYLQEAKNTFKAFPKTDWLFLSYVSFSEGEQPAVSNKIKHRTLSKDEFTSFDNALLGKPDALLNLGSPCFPSVWAKIYVRSRIISERLEFPVTFGAEDVLFNCGYKKAVRNPLLLQGGAYYHYRLSPSSFTHTTSGLIKTISTYSLFLDTVAKLLGDDETTKNNALVHHLVLYLGGTLYHYLAATGSTSICKIAKTLRSTFPLKEAENLHISSVKDLGFKARWLLKTLKAKNFTLAACIYKLWKPFPKKNQPTSD